MRRGLHLDVLDISSSLRTLYH